MLIILLEMDIFLRGSAIVDLHFAPSISRLKPGGILKL